MTRAKLRTSRTPLPKTPTGIDGLDEVTGGGLPKGRTTLVYGSPGCGKTLLAMEFLVNGALQYCEPGVCMEFEEATEKLTANVRSLGLDLHHLVKRKKLLVDHVRVERNEIEETGEYNLEGLFIRLGHAVDSIKAKRVVLDSIETLFAGLTNAAILRAELRRLFRWLDDRNLTAIVTAERGNNGMLTRHGLDEYTYMIDDDGVSVLPITSLALAHKAPAARVSTGVSGLDEMLGKKGFFRGSSVLVSGTAGTGKSSIAAKFANSACARGENCLYFAFEESPSQIIRNMRSVGINLEPCIQKRLLHFHAVRPTSTGLEGHLASMQKLVKNLQPSVVVVDPITSIVSVSGIYGVKSMLTRLVDFLKVQQITSIFTNLTFGNNREERTEEGISSLMDTWIVLWDGERNGQRTRGLYVVKSRGMAHSRELRELAVSRKGVELGDVMTGSGLVTVVAG